MGQGRFKPLQAGLQPIPAPPGTELDTLWSLPRGQHLNRFLGQANTSQHRPSRNHGPSKPATSSPSLPQPWGSGRAREDRTTPPSSGLDLTHTDAEGRPNLVQRQGWGEGVPPFLYPRGAYPTTPPNSREALASPTPPLPPLSLDPGRKLGICTTFRRGRDGTQAGF